MSVRILSRTYRQEKLRQDISRCNRGQVSVAHLPFHVDVGSGRPPKLSQELWAHLQRYFRVARNPSTNVKVIKEAYRYYSNLSEGHGSGMTWPHVLPKTECGVVDLCKWQRPGPKSQASAFDGHVRFRKI